MQEIYIENIAKVIKNKARLEKQLKVKITNRGKLVFVDGPAENEYIALKVLEALDLDFPIEEALLLKNENIELNIINIKDVTKRHDLERVRARIIGTHGRALKTLEHLTQCHICLHDNRVGIIGDCEEIEDAVQSITSLIHGSKHGNVYARAEKRRKEKRLESKDLNIKNELE
jgi:KH domain-containing protein